MNIIKVILFINSLYSTTTFQTTTLYFWPFIKNINLEDEEYLYIIKMGQHETYHDSCPKKKN